ncbi:Stp1/IreP family PP2C-type Ser/Thr phosphatase [Candidatus Cyanaurora vandensis]|uniref:Stp1/IreP family PP2C-type Ser/Thr phosphatase n=1 Tax=Candidatus Cyanaurora vandensis TaxID=2714958 RepID=UPI00257EFFAF|nr:Stp1/IreP family PP2C-type Ser/Thr phosphatase [Candidatus Cyanaurora vandensis]
MTEFALTVAGNTHVGCVRTNNQDAYYLDPNAHFFILADGMGGYTGGEIASAITIQTIARHLHRTLREEYNSTRPPQDWLNQAALLANTAVLEDAQGHPQRADMGTTVVIALPLKNTLWYAYVGDSRLYRWREGQLQQLTHDHTLVADMVAHGLLPSEDARRHPYRNVLSRCLGRADLKQAEVSYAVFQTEDRYLICSDGLTEEVSDEQIAEILAQPLDDQAACDQLIALANAQGGRDNTTVVILSVGISPG